MKSLVSDQCTEDEHVDPASFMLALCYLHLGALYYIKLTEKLDSNWFIVFATVSLFHRWDAQKGALVLIQYLSFENT